MFFKIQEIVKCEYNKWGTTLNMKTSENYLLLCKKVSYCIKEICYDLTFHDSISVNVGMLVGNVYCMLVDNNYRAIDIMQE